MIARLVQRWLQKIQDHIDNSVAAVRERFDPDALDARYEMEED